jgi:hypothetical protein
LLKFTKQTLYFACVIDQKKEGNRWVLVKKKQRVIFRLKNERSHLNFETSKSDIFSSFRCSEHPELSNNIPTNSKELQDPTPLLIVSM